MKFFRNRFFQCQKRIELLHFYWALPVRIIRSHLSGALCGYCNTVYIVVLPSRVIVLVVVVVVIGVNVVGVVIVGVVIVGGVIVGVVIVGVVIVGVVIVGVVVVGVVVFVVVSVVVANSRIYYCKK